MKRYKIKTENIYNIDEHSIGLGICLNVRVLGEATIPQQHTQRKKTQVKSSQKQEWVTIIECISARGTLIQPVVIFKGEHLQLDYFPQTTPDYRYICQTQA